ncbi:MAG TPA: hypothetical protein VI248_14315 [Kineosporiaceae bacterium]
MATLSVASRLISCAATWLRSASLPTSVATTVIAIFEALRH